METDSKQVLRRKDEKNFEKRVKRREIVEKEAVEENYLDVTFGTRGRASVLRSTSLACGASCNLLCFFFISKRQNEVIAIGKTLGKVTGQPNFLAKYIAWLEGPSGDFVKMASTDPS